MSRRIAVALGACLAALVVGQLAGPARYEIDGLSMAPGLMPGDVVVSDAFPVADRLRQPRRFERWVVDSPDGIAIKRLVGLPGETVSIGGGDLSINGTRCLKGPRLVAETAVEVPQSAGPERRRHVRFDGCEVLDDADFATEVNRPLLPVRDVGIAMIVRAPTTSTRIHIGIDASQVTWELAAHHRACFVAGRLDGHLVATGWTIPDARAPVEGGCLPTPAPDTWSHVIPLPEGDAATTDAPAITLDVHDDTAVVEQLTLWRDVLYRPGADGREEWRLKPDEFFMLGDFPTASRDSRHWGPLPREALRHRVLRAEP